jgi:cell division protein FtsB
LATSTRRSTKSTASPNEQLVKENNKLKTEIGKLRDSARCLRCGKLKPTSDFYVSTDPMN